MTRQFTKFLISFLLLIFVLVPAVVFAAGTGSGSGVPAQNLTGAREITNQFAGDLGYSTEDVSTPEVIIGRIINVVLSFLGIVFMVLMIYGGYSWLTAGGNEEKVNKAKDLIINSVIGLAIVFAAFMLSYFVLGAVLKAVVGTPVAEG